MKKLVRESIGDILKGKSKEDVIPGEDLVVFKRTSPSKASGTSLAGEVNTSYKRLIELFGEPEDYSQDGYKVAFTWVVEDDKGRVATLYDWKATSLYDGDGLDPQELKEIDSWEWHIGTGEGGYKPPAWIRNHLTDLGAPEEEEEKGTITYDLTNFIYFYEGQVSRK